MTKANACTESYILNNTYVLHALIYLLVFYILSRDQLLIVCQP